MIQNTYNITNEYNLGVQLKDTDPIKSYKHFSFALESAVIKLKNNTITPNDYYYYLGLLYMNKYGGITKSTSSDITAYSYLLRSADLGHAEAQYEYAIRMKDINMEECKKYLEKAANQNHQGAIDAIKNINNK